MCDVVQIANSCCDGRIVSVLEGQHKNKKKRVFPVPVQVLIADFFFPCFCLLLKVATAFMAVSSPPSLEVLRPTCGA